jgi:hypothetical protein
MSLIFLSPGMGKKIHVRRQEKIHLAVVVAGRGEDTSQLEDWRLSP